MTDEYRVRTEGRGRKVDEWKLPASKPDNHPSRASGPNGWLDCLVGCALAASMPGVSAVREAHDNVGAAGRGARRARPTRSDMAVLMRHSEPGLGC